MRISDWSSDVCSSDLPPAINPCSMQRNANAEEHPWRSRRICGFDESEINRRCGRCDAGRGRRFGHRADEPDRTRGRAGGWVHGEKLSGADLAVAGRGECWMTHVSLAPGARAKKPDTSP